MVHVVKKILIFLGQVKNPLAMPHLWLAAEPKME